MLCFVLPRAKGEGGTKTRRVSRQGVHAGSHSTPGLVLSDQIVCRDLDWHRPSLAVIFTLASELRVAHHLTFF